VRITPRHDVLDQLEARRDAIVIKFGIRPVHFRVGFRLASNLTIQQIGLRINKNTLAQGVLKDESMYRWAKRPPKTPPVGTTTSSGHKQFMDTWSAQLVFLSACFLHPFTQDSRWHPLRHRYISHMSIDMCLKCSCTWLRFLLYSCLVAL
jgi:hypothetical protein